MRALLISAATALILDQASKYAVVHGLELARKRAIDVLPPVLNFRYGENRGINFGLFEGESDASRWILVAFSLIVVAAVVVWIRRSPRPTTMLVSAGLLIGGAIGNVVDRLYYGYVLDFLNTTCCGLSNPFVFNVADIFIFLGAAGLILFDNRNAPPGPKGKKAA